MSTGSLRAALLASAAVAAAGAGARAAPLEDTTVGGAVFTGPTHPDATSIYVNPAALGMGGRGFYIYAGGAVTLDQNRVRRRVVDADGDVSDGPTVSPLTISPGGTFAIYNVGEDVSFGGAVSLPLDQEFISDEEALGYHTLGGRHRQVAWATIAMSLRPVRRVYIGVSASLMATYFELEFLRDSALAAGSDPDRGVPSDCGGAPCGVENPQAAERYRVRAETGRVFSTNSIALTAGVVIEVAPGWWLGLSYSSPPGFLSPIRLDGNVEVTAAPRDGGATARGDADVVFDLPQTVSFGGRGPAFRGFEWIANARLSSYSRHEAYDMRFFGGNLDQVGAPEVLPRYRGLSDVFTFGAGLEQRWSDEGGFLRFGNDVRRARVGARVRVESAAVDANAVTPLQLDGFNVGAVTGAEIRLGRSFVVSLSYGFRWFPETGGDESVFDPTERIACVDSGYDLDTCRAAAEGRAIPTAAGDYRRLSHSFRLNFRYERL